MEKRARCNPCYGCCGCIDQASIGLIQRWGRFERIAEPGFHCLNPFAGQCLAAILSTRVTTLHLYVETNSKDNVFVEIECSVQYRIDRQNADDAFYELINPKEQIQDYVYDVVRAMVPTINFTELFVRKDEVAKSLREELKKVMRPYGYTIEQVLVTNIVRILDPAVRKVMNEINAERWKDALAKISAELDTVKQMFRMSEVFYNNDTKRTLLLRIRDEKFPISYNELYAVFSPFGNLKNVAVLSSSDTFHSRVCFEHEEDAIRAIKSLQGQNIFEECCEMEIVLASKVDQEGSSMLDESNVETRELGSSLADADLTLKQTQDDLINMEEPEPPVSSSILGYVTRSHHVAERETPSVSILGHGSSEPEPPVSSLVLGYVTSSQHVAEREAPSISILGHGSSVRHIAHEKFPSDAKLR